MYEFISANSSPTDMILPKCTNVNNFQKGSLCHGVTAKQKQRRRMALVGRISSVVGANQNGEGNEGTVKGCRRHSDDAGGCGDGGYHDVWLGLG